MLVAAGQSSARRAPALAARWYAAALHLLPDVARTEAERIELLVALATALGGAGQLEESRDVLCEVLERLPPATRARIAIVAYCAGVEHLLGRHRDADARLAEAHRTSPDSASADAVALEIELAAGAGFENRYEDMAAWAEQALAGATRDRQRALEVAAAGQLGLAHYFLGLPAAVASSAPPPASTRSTTPSSPAAWTSGCGWAGRRRCSSATSRRSPTASA